MQERLDLGWCRYGMMEKQVQKEIGRGLKDLIIIESSAHKAFQADNTIFYATW